MTLSIDDPEAVEVARELAATTGGTVADAIVTALRERLERERHTRRPCVGERLRHLARETQAIPVLDDRHPEQMLGYDGTGLPS